MKRIWETEELIENWTLMPPELELLTNKTGATRLGFALLLKFFQHQARFPKDVQEISEAVITYVAKQTNVEPELHRQYDWYGRSIKYHRAQIRELHGFREATVADANALMRWLGEFVLPQERDPEHLKDALSRNCRESRIEPPTPERIDRLVRSASRSYEEDFCAGILARLSLENQTRLDALLQPSLDEEKHRHAHNEEQAELQRTLWQNLKTDPGRASTDTMLEEMDKLEKVRALNLPIDLFGVISFSRTRVLLNFYPFF